MIWLTRLLLWYRNSEVSDCPTIIIDCHCFGNPRVWRELTYQVPERFRETCVEWTAVGREREQWQRWSGGQGVMKGKRQGLLRRIDGSWEKLSVPLSTENAALAKTKDNYDQLANRKRGLKKHVIYKCALSDPVTIFGK